MSGKTIAIAFLSISIVLIIIFAHGKITDLEETISERDIRIASLEETISERNNQIAQLKIDVSTLQDHMDVLRKDNQEMQSEIEFRDELWALYISAVREDDGPRAKRAFFGMKDYALSKYFPRDKEQ